MGIINTVDKLLDKIEVYNTHGTPLVNGWQVWKKTYDLLPMGYLWQIHCKPVYMIVTKIEHGIDPWQMIIKTITCSRD